MAVQDFMKSGIGPRRACKITSVDPENRSIEATLKDATTVQVAVFDTPGLFIWPKVGEYWTIHQREGFWMLDHRTESYDDEQKISDLKEGEGRIDADVVKTISGKDFVTIDAKNLTEGASLVYSKDGWSAVSISDSITGGGDSNKSIPLIDASSVTLKDDLLIKYKGDSWVPTSSIKVDSIEISGTQFDNSFTYNTGSVVINSVNTSYVVGTGTTFTSDMVGGKITVSISGTNYTFNITDFTDASNIKIANPSGTNGSATSYSITYGAKIQTGLKIDDNASINVGKSSIINFESFETITLKDSSLIEIIDSQLDPTENTYHATTSNIKLGNPQLNGRGVNFNTKGDISVYGSATDIASITATNSLTNYATIKSNGTVSVGDNKAYMTLTSGGEGLIASSQNITAGTGVIVGSNDAYMTIDNANSNKGLIASTGNITAGTGIVLSTNKAYMSIDSGNGNRGLIASTGNITAGTGVIVGSNDAYMTTTGGLGLIASNNNVTAAKGMIVGTNDAYMTTNGTQGTIASNFRITSPDPIDGNTPDDAGIYMNGRLVATRSWVSNNTLTLTAGDLILAGNIKTTGTNNLFIQNGHAVATEDWTDAAYVSKTDYSSNFQKGGGIANAWRSYEAGPNRKEWSRMVSIGSWTLDSGQSNDLVITLPSGIYANQQPIFATYVASAGASNPIYFNWGVQIKDGNYNQIVINARNISSANNLIFYGIINLHITTEENIG